MLKIILDDAREKNYVIGEALKMNRKPFYVNEFLINRRHKWLLELRKMKKETNGKILCAYSKNGSIIFRLADEPTMVRYIRNDENINWVRHHINSTVARAN